ncbi:hypothetical protein [Umezawaea tangerina]|uniref:hypothetical protein n=1 Tax=Umezawaea tangerina TaxID=84725 RepID=UPI000D05C7AB|nr:hypothetical protein [Umezawaea tangerina]
MGALLISGLATTGVVAYSAAPASAMPSPVHSSANLLRIADSARPSEDDLDYRMAPVGTWRDGNGPERTSKSYFTFLLQNYFEVEIVSATVSVTEISANDCAKPRATELWRTEVAHNPSWLNQPAELSRVEQTGAEPGCVSSRITWDVLDEVRDAAGSQEMSLTLALLMPEERMGDPAYGRKYADDLSIDLVYTDAPTAPADPTVDGEACRWDGNYTLSPRPVLGALRRNPWYGWSQTVFTAWDAADPSAAFTTVVDYGENGPMEVRLPEGFTVDGHTYEWTARARDVMGDLSRPEPPCRFTIAPTPVNPPVTTPHDPAPGTPAS